jgi:flagellar L-ring protein FlgH
MTRLTTQTILITAILAYSATAFGQSNSLFGRRPSANPSRKSAPSAKAAPAADPDASDKNAADDRQPQTRLASNQQPQEPRGVAPASAGPSIRLPYMPLRKPMIGQPQNAALYAVSTIAVLPPEPEKIKPGDTVTIIIREIKTSTTDAKTDLKKDWQLQSQLAQWFRLDPRDRLVPQNFERAGKPGADFSFQNDWKGEGKVDRRDELTTRIQATVIDVKPNGNLVLEAKKNIGSDEERQVMTLTGTCRSRDVTAENTVLSTQIADLNIESKHTGAARDAARRGWLMRAFDWLRPI